MSLVRTWSMLGAMLWLTGCGQPLPVPATPTSGWTVRKLSDYRSDAPPEELVRDLETLRARPPVGATLAEASSLRDEHWTLLIGLADRVLESDAVDPLREIASTVRLEALSEQALSLAPLQSVPGAATDPRISAFLEAAKLAVLNREKLPQTAAAASAMRVRTAGIFLREAGRDQEAWMARLGDFCIQQALAHYPGRDRTAERELASAANLAETLGANRTALACYEAWSQAWPQDQGGKLAAFAARRLRGVGKPFTLKGQLYPEGEFDLASLKGKKVLVHLWSSNSPAQAERMQELARAYQTLRGAGFELVGVCLDADDKQLKQASQAGLLTWPQLFTPRPANDPNPHPLAASFGVGPSPFFLLVDEEGKLADSFLSSNELGRLMQSIVKPPQPK